ncbi:ATP-binding cassette sub-family C member 4-like [Phymastichus coffea]|uniref:ATP-binding cassette sub-family C member 4-like n=1 Tax=Phymastichus coffea TaxID=108790 RepID=UPI00273B257B|nr:ATP-binding cassette sub-family C member 4-like [Phymastichus coffea]
MGVKNKNHVNPNPLISARWINKTFFWWLTDLIRYGRNQDLVANDLYDTISEDRSEILRKCLEIAWQNEKNTACIKKRKPSLWKAFIRTYFREFLKLSLFILGSTIIMTIEPCLLELMMSYFHPTSTMTQMQAYLNATAFIFLMVLRSLLSRHGFFHLTRLGMRARIAHTSLIYKKMVRMSVSASKSHNSSVISLLTTDVSKFDTFFTFSPYMIIVPIQVVATTYLIWQYVDLNSTLLSVALMIFLTMPVLALYNKIFLIFRTKQTLRTDKRLLLISEIVSGIRAIKMYVWENYFEDRVRIARGLEIGSYLKIAYLTSIVGATAHFCHRLCVFVIILICLGQHSIITARQILPIAQHFNNLRDSITSLLFLALRRIADLRVSMKRIEDFLLMQEVDLNVEKIKYDNTDEIISIKNVTVSLDDQSHILENINLNFAPKNLYAIVGAVGSGKSLLLKLILGELRLTSGRVFVNGKLSYASQEPWLFPGSIRDNILFGEEYDEKRYDNVVSACALLEDFAHLPYADKTMVGDKGMNLSGGQCARVNLARAVYRDADIYLFDNPLSAVDTRVAKKLMDECIHKLLEHKTRLIITHNMELLTEVDDIIFLNSGTIEFRGNIENFRRNDLYLKHLPSDQTDNLDQGLDILKLKTDVSNTIINSSKINNEPLETEELIAKGTVKMSVYSRYIKAGGIYRLLLMVFLTCIFVLSVMFYDYGLVKWIQERNSSSLNKVEYNATTYSVNSDQNIPLILGGIILVIVILSIVINIGSNIFMLCASNNIHNDMFSHLIRTTLRFFESNPSGRILNRFSDDTRIADDLLPKVLFEVIQPFFMVTALTLSVVIVNWWIIIPSSILIFLFVLIGKMYVATVQKLTRLVGNAKSPVLSFIASSLAGLTTIRACKAEDIVSKDFDSRQDRHTAAQFLVWALIPANYLWAELTNLGLLTTTVYVCIILKNDDTFEGYVGLTLMQIMNMTTELSSMLIRLVQSLAYMPNIERMLQYTELPQEDFTSNKLEKKLPKSWPNKGGIKFEKLYLRYLDDSDPVLWNISFTIASGSKIGIVGRTGAGKSSLTSAIFRTANIEGSLSIDGVDVKNVDLPTLRSKISIIPQEPFLFKATLRKNLDPVDEFKDALLWSALDDVELKEMFNTLEFPIEFGGSNLSLGQRQLVCLARAILKQNKILILDEATATIDLATDALIQKTIRDKFNKCTVLTIAHRLNTVVDSDKILVMENGRVMEYDHPYLLLQNNDSYFSKMIQQTNNAMLRQLKTIAEQAYMKLQ